MAGEHCSDGGLPARLRGREGGHLYGGPVFAAAAGADLDLALLEPADDWLPRLPDEFRRRDIALTSLGEARWSRAPMFVKQPWDKDLLNMCADSLPSAVVVDVGLAGNADRGDEHWAVVEVARPPRHVRNCMGRVVPDTGCGGPASAGLP
jgi:hypothetical protein